MSLSGKRITQQQESGIAWVACFSQPTLLGINVGLTIEPLAQPTVTSTQALCPVLSG